MELVTRTATFKGPENWFAGDVWADVLHRGEDPSRVRMNMVRFTPGSRTAWHSHGLGQTLYIVEGIALFGSRDGSVIEAHPGDVVHTPPNEDHWHAAAPDRFMAHIALWEGDEVDWQEHVSEAEYNGPRVRSCNCEH
jgi:quercetin dioxygenase-like cupin family protein